MALSIISPPGKLNPAWSMHLNFVYWPYWEPISIRAKTDTNCLNWSATSRRYRGPNCLI